MTREQSEVFQERLVTKLELANHLGISTRKVDLDIREGLPWVPVGMRKRFRVSEVLTWYAQT